MYAGQSREGQALVTTVRQPCPKTPFPSERTAPIYHPICEILRVSEGFPSFVLQFVLT